MHKGCEYRISSYYQDEGHFLEEILEQYFKVYLTSSFYREKQNE